MLLYALIAVVVVLLIFIVIVAMRPADFCVVRSTSIAAPPTRVFPHVNDLHEWEAWSPWQKIDPNCKQTYSGAAAGEGASMMWDGNKAVGSGRMTITNAKLSELVRLKLEFFRPFKATNTAELTFKQNGAGSTNVEWAMTGHCNFMFKMMGLFMSMDNMVGKDFEKGLAQLKQVVESEGAKR